VSKETDAEAKMQAINVAYDTLSDATKKLNMTRCWIIHKVSLILDKAIQMGLTAHSSIAKAQVKALTLVALRIYLVDLAQVLVADNNVRNVKQRSYRGEDQHASIQVDLDIAYHGSTQQITLQIPTYNVYGEPEVQRKTLQVKIPKGMKEGQQIRLNGQGQSGINGGENGDLYIEIQYKDTDRIRIEGADVYQTIDVSPWEAALGQSIEVNTPAGQLKVNLPKNAKNGQQLRLKDKGYQIKPQGIYI
jgi:curved DNA-binding protein